MDFKFQLPTREQLPTLDSMTANFHSAKNKIKEKFQNNNLLNGEALLEFAKENSVELGAVGAAILASGLAIYSIPSETLVDNANSTNARNLTSGITQNPDNGINNETINGTKITSGIINGTVSPEVPSGLTTGVVTAVAIISLVALSRLCRCCSKVCRNETKAEREARLQAEKESAARKIINDKTKKVEEVGKSTQYMNDYVNKIVELNILGDSLEAREAYRDKLLNCKNLKVLPEVKIMTLVAREHLDLVKRDGMTLEDAKNSLAKCFFNNVPDSQEDNEISNAELAYNTALILYQNNDKSTATADEPGKEKEDTELKRPKLEDLLNNKTATNQAVGELKDQENNLQSQSTKNKNINQNPGDEEQPPMLLITPPQNKSTLTLTALN